MMDILSRLDRKIDAGRHFRNCEDYHVMCGARDEIRRLRKDRKRLEGQLSAQQEEYADLRDRWTRVRTILLRAMIHAVRAGNLDGTKPDRMIVGAQVARDLSMVGPERVEVAPGDVVVVAPAPRAGVEIGEREPA